MKWRESEESEQRSGPKLCVTAFDRCHSSRSVEVLRFVATKSRCRTNANSEIDGGRQRRVAQGAGFCLPPERQRRAWSDGLSSAGLAGAALIGAGSRRRARVGH
jgi:hypothetical protein